MKKLDRTTFPAFIYIVYLFENEVEGLECHKQFDEIVFEEKKPNSHYKQLEKHHIAKIKRIREKFITGTTTEDSVAIKVEFLNTLISGLSKVGVIKGLEDIMFKCFCKTYKDKISKHFEKKIYNKENKDTFLNHYFPLIESIDNESQNKNSFNSIKYVSPTLEKENNTFKIVLTPIMEVQLEKREVKEDELSFHYLKTYLRDSFEDIGVTANITILSQKDRVNPNLLNHFDLIIHGITETLNYETITQLTYKISGKRTIGKDYNLKINKRYAINGSLMPEKGSLPTDVIFISTWSTVLYYYFKDDLEECLSQISMLENIQNNKRILKEFPIGAIEISFIKSVVYMLQDERDDALGEFASIIKKTSIDTNQYAYVISKAYHNMGVIYRVENKYSKAIPSFEKSIEFNKKQWQSYWELGRIAVYSQKIISSKNDNSNGHAIEIESFKNYYEKAVKLSKRDDVKKEFDLINDDSKKELRKIKAFMDENSIKTGSVIKGKNK